MSAGRSELTRGRIVVGVDGSAPSKVALRWAARIAPVISGDIQAMIIWEYPVSYGWAIAVSEDWRPDLDASKVLKETRDDVFDASCPPGLVTTVWEGHASAVLLNASKNADMLIVGSRGHVGSLAFSSVQSAPHAQSTLTAQSSSCIAKIIGASRPTPDPIPLPKA